jgi:hypothetical protein
VGSHGSGPFISCRSCSRREDSGRGSRLQATDSGPRVGLPCNMGQFPKSGRSGGPALALGRRLMSGRRLQAAVTQHS